MNVAKWRIVPFRRRNLAFDGMQWIAAGGIAGLAAGAVFCLYYALAGLGIGIAAGIGFAVGLRGSKMRQLGY
ncbi:MAG: hypothetical protein EOS07_34685 [Mesorhizobium sp.]|uniref:hypothetical protein n=1 Tax=Mesorhizobium sp. TaxID=1871066 RepID=UPI000FE3A51F|nr:hypothetical protein [Mesorhizobium sp.]RWB96240.1 MAG: hypothetical protein EOQ56_26735 [Mesorhizobium sp.]RWO03363.1 MAG: hypothetical protein EOS07_34685 [Mesorhizobium sp.]RWO22444.1 MAG: hypothetical protein EOS08_18710 [Mesorhizobium sp.]RWO97966.1 MAG: hypothetical protein EOQ99_31125 [Mesorhizobium sp.]RWP24445.1 MAG: hypothetical protein EOR02_31150 [Mesorhizobium sp.]